MGIALFLIFLVIIAIGGGLLMYSAGQRKRGGQSGKSEVVAQTQQTDTPKVGRPVGPN